MTKKEKIIIWLKKSALGLFIVSIYLTIRWSDYSVIDICIFNNSIFVPNEKVDAAMLNLVTGYFTGYLVYILTTVIPSMIRDNFVMKQVSESLFSFYSKSIYILLLMAKSAATDMEWEKVIQSSTDLECFNDNYYSIMKKFDVTSPAETMLTKIEKNNEKRVLAWYEYLELQFNTLYNEVDDIFLRYHVNMDEDTVKYLYAIKKSSIFDMFLGKGISSSMFYTDFDGIEYQESLPFSMYCAQAKEKVAPIFSVNHGIDGTVNLKEFVALLTTLKKIIEEYINDNRSNPAYVLAMFTSHNIGRTNTSRIIVKEGNDIEQ